MFAHLTTMFDRSNILIAGLVAAPVSLAVTAPRRFRPPARLLIRAMLIAVAFVTLFYHQDSLWFRYCTGIPGAAAIRAVGRIVLILLIPAALGLASLVEFLERRGRVVAAWIVALVCLAEQGVTTDTFDAAENRASIAALVRRIDRGRTAFYYHPCENQRNFRYQLDAMWASLASGLPTINGYSGHFPRDFVPLFYIDSDPDREVEDVLTEWERVRGLSSDRIQWIGADCPRKNSVRSAGAPADRSLLALVPRSSLKPARFPRLSNEKSSNHIIMTYNDTLASSSLRGSDTTGKVKLPSGATWGSIVSVALALGIGVLGVVMAHYPMIVSGFRRIQTDLGDTRLIHYLLEHGYRWVRGEPGTGISGVRPSSTRRRMRRPIRTCS